jgi:hypothetical protein
LVDEFFHRVSSDLDPLGFGGGHAPYFAPRISELHPEPFPNARQNKNSCYTHKAGFYQTH